ncbi:probable disease resistance protein At5g63020 [Mercurialis annua]|uniref:probable disease resistance protein At5g63020 n=1 Tax=Mercurialis annua TaxID=3986 RepID=UPI002160D699|nr:probable disease resistance protein At5g63020 [Mercurialis annua]
MKTFCSSTMKHICQLEHNLDALNDALHKLKIKIENIQTSVKIQENPYEQPTYQVVDWLYRAELLESQVSKVLAQGEEKLRNEKYGCCCLMRCSFSYKLGKLVYHKIETVNRILIESNFDAVVLRLPHDSVEVIHVETTVGFESNLGEVWRRLGDESVGVVGVYGMVGAGKTTLLNKIRDELVVQGFDFQVVIWVQVCRGAGFDGIQNAIHKKLGSPDERWRVKSVKDRALVVSELLGEKKFILFLDDLWDRLDLVKIGVPLRNENGSKIVFATRSEGVCNEMKAQVKVKVNCMPREEALKLFWMNVGEDNANYHDQVEYLADVIHTQVCQGLPLALVVIGRAMGRMRSHREWELAASTLKNDPGRLPGMKHIFHILDTSYGSMEDDVLIRNCFLYCCLLPGMVRKDELISLWIGEGFLDMSNKNLGEYIIKRLELSCLLESDEISDCVGMHRVYRAFGLWLASEYGKKKDEIFLQDQRYEKWTKAVRISISGLVGVMPPSNPCPLVQTLLIRDTNLSVFPAAFLQSMNALRVLDLSGNKILDELSLSSIGVLINLQYLNLSYTSLRELPTEVKTLKKLKVLLLDYTENLLIICKGLISSLSSLQLFSKLGNEIFDDTFLLEELECLEYVPQINVCLFSHQAIQRMVSSEKLQSCIRKLSLRKVKGLKIPISILSRMVNLEELTIEECEILAAETEKDHYCVLNFRDLRIRHCSAICSLEWLIFAPKLRTLDLSSCESLLEVIGKDFRSEEIKEIDERLGIFSSVQQLRLQNLPSLERICPQILHFPVLKDLLVIGCPRLLKLPLDSRCINVLKQIKGSRAWLDQLHWEDENVRAVFYSKFQDCIEPGGVQHSTDSVSSSPHTVIEEQQNLEPLNIRVEDEIVPVKHKSGTSHLSVPSAGTVLSMMKRKSVLEPRVGKHSIVIVSPKPFTYKELKQATNNFLNQVGAGGYGKVYKGILTNGEVIAVKIFKNESSRSSLGFQTEMKIAGRIHHRNVVKLVGSCIHKVHQMLVYEFVPNNTLRYHLYDLDKVVISWSKRMKIALGTAKGLAYLHEGCSPRIVHRDIKPCNILIDYNFEPKITDFATAVEFSDDDSDIEADITGTMGYLDPEYLIKNSVSDKVDVFSFGVVLLELITGETPQRPIERYNSENLLFEVKRVLGTRDYDYLIDPKLQKEYNEDEMQRMIYCAAACVYKPGRDRPKMSEIVEALQGNMPLERIWSNDDVKFLFLDNFKQPYGSFQGSGRSREESDWEEVWEHMEEELSTAR